MKMSMTGQMRQEQRMKLAPRMIQSMEILQLPLLALQERIEQELNNNPVLEQQEPVVEEPEGDSEELAEVEMGEQDLVVSEDLDKVAEFERLSDVDSDFDDYMSRSVSNYKASSEQSDKKHEAMQNTAAKGESLHDHLLDQWRLIDAEGPVRMAGFAIIDYIDEKGYLSIQLEQLYNKDRQEFGLEDLQKALELVQKLEPAGVGARDMKECLLIQLSQSGEDRQFEKELISEYMELLLGNHLPEIAKKMNCDLEQVNLAIRRISKLDTSPGLQIETTPNHIINVDVIVEQAEDDKGYSVRLADLRTPFLRVNNYYSRMSQNKQIDDKTRDFLRQNIQSANWLIDAIEQRKATLLKVAKSVVRQQEDFFEKGQLYLKPLPMSVVADEVGVHVATVSRAVSGKYVQCPQGIFPLRGFFSGGMETTNGDSESWDAIRARMQKIVDGEDKCKPLSDEQIRLALENGGVKNIARRTVAKYRKLMNIPSARMRKKY